MSLRARAARQKSSVCRQSTLARIVPEWDFCTGHHDPEINSQGHMSDATESNANIRDIGRLVKRISAPTQADIESTAYAYLSLRAFCCAAEKALLLA
jgi:hypothetical protein